MQIQPVIFRKSVTAAALAAAVGLAAPAAAQTGAHPSATQKFSVTAPGIWNQLYFYDYNTNVGTMGRLNSGSVQVDYNLRSSFSVAADYSNYTGIFIYDYDVARWREVFYAADATAFVW